MASPTEPRIVTTKQLELPLTQENGLGSGWTAILTVQEGKLQIGFHFGDKETPTHYGTLDLHLLRELTISPPHINLIEEFAKHPGWELNKGYKDGDEEGEYGWCVHEVSGNANDREWQLIGFGDTPGLAIMRAIEASQ